MGVLTEQGGGGREKKPHDTSGVKPSHMRTRAASHSAYSRWGPACLIALLAGPARLVGVLGKARWDRAWKLPLGWVAGKENEQVRDRRNTCGCEGGHTPNGAAKILGVLVTK